MSLGGVAARLPHLAAITFLNTVSDTALSIKKWKFPDGNFVFNFSGHEAIINTLSVNEEGVLFSGADNGTMTMWDYATGLPFQHLKDIPQPGSLDAESVSPDMPRRFRSSIHFGVSLTPGHLLLVV